MALDSVTPPATLLELFGRLGGAALAGAALGLNREIHQKPAGLRTHAMVALGAALFAVLPLGTVAADAARDWSSLSRVIQGIITGVGFIGGGVILHRSATKEVYGLTTATSIWLAAALGAAMGLGLWRSTLLATGIGLLVLVLGGPLDGLVRRGRRSGPAAYESTPSGGEDDS